MLVASLLTGLAVVQTKSKICGFDIQDGHLAPPHDLAFNIGSRQSSNVIAITIDIILITDHI